MSPLNSKTTSADEPEETGETAVTEARVEEPVVPGDVWSVWLPSPDANLEIRWQVLAAGRGEVRFPVQVLAVADLASPPSVTHRRLRGLVLTPHLPEPRRRIAELVVQTTLSPGQTEVPFSLYPPFDPKPLFRGVLQAEYPEGGGGARLVVRELVYVGGHAAAKVLYPPLAAGAAAAGE
jgi:hypothetical protein